VTIGPELGDFITSKELYSLEAPGYKVCYDIVLACQEAFAGFPSARNCGQDGLAGAQKHQAGVVMNMQAACATEPAVLQLFLNWQLHSATSATVPQMFNDDV
jgi:hypothetical protein